MVRRKVIDMKQKLIAITGGIGSGKSQAMKILYDNGYIVLSCDDFTPLAYEDKKIKEFLIENFGSADKNQIKKIVFNSPELYKKLTSVVTKKVFELTIKKANEIGGKVFIEVPLLFECGYQNLFDAVIVITRDKAKRLEAVKIRSNLSENEVLSRMNAQFNYDSSDLSSFYVIENDDTIERLKDKILSVAEKI